MKEPLLLRQAGDTSSDIITKDEDRIGEQVEDGLLCWKCGHVITSIDLFVEVGGRHQHTFFNPAGVIYEIGCFSHAAGCLQYGPATSEFTWFAGYTWRLSLCVDCNTHLGWFFSASESSFFGLILKNLTSS